MVLEQTGQDQAIEEPAAAAQSSRSVGLMRANRYLQRIAAKLVACSAIGLVTKRTHVRCLRQDKTLSAARRKPAARFAQRAISRAFIVCGGS